MSDDPGYQYRGLGSKHSGGRASMALMRSWIVGSGLLFIVLGLGTPMLALLYWTPSSVEHWFLVAALGAVGAGLAVLGMIRVVRGFRMTPDEVVAQVQSDYDNAPAD